MACPVVNLSTRRGLLPFKACGGIEHAVGKRKLGVKVNVDNTELTRISVKNRVQIRKSRQRS